MDKTEPSIQVSVTRTTHDSLTGQKRDRSSTTIDRKYSESSSEAGTRSSPGVYRGVDQPDLVYANRATTMIQTQQPPLHHQQQAPMETVRQTPNPPVSYGRPFAANLDAGAGGLRTARERPPSGSSSNRTSGGSGSTQAGRTSGVSTTSYGIAVPVRIAPPFVGQTNNLDQSDSQSHPPYGTAVYSQTAAKAILTQNSSEPITRYPVGDQRVAMRRSQSDDSLNPANSAMESSSSNSGASAFPAPQTTSGLLNQPQPPPRQYRQQYITAAATSSQHQMGPPQAQAPPPPPRPAARTSRSQQPFSLVLLAQKPSAARVAGSGSIGGGGLPHSASSPQRFDLAPAPPQVAGSSAAAPFANTGSSSVVLRSAALRPAAAAAIGNAHVPIHGSHSGSAASTPTSQSQTPRYSMHLPDADSLSWNSLVRAALTQPPPRTLCV